MSMASLGGEQGGDEGVEVGGVDGAAGVEVGDIEVAGVSGWLGARRPYLLFQGLSDFSSPRSSRPDGHGIRQIPHLKPRFETK